MYWLFQSSSQFVIHQTNGAIFVAYTDMPSTFLFVWSGLQFLLNKRVKSNTGHLTASSCSVVSVVSPLICPGFPSVTSQPKNSFHLLLFHSRESNVCDLSMLRWIEITFSGWSYFSSLPNGTIYQTNTVPWYSFPFAWPVYCWQISKISKV